ncbi:MAG: hypothetical protein AAFM92_10380 [Pseudomonadota bacterium]
MTILEKVNILILLLTVSYVMALSNLLSGIDDIQPPIAWLTTFLTSIGLFRLLVLLAYRLINRSDALLALYHRNRFVKGLWTYSYEAHGKRDFGIWRISQDVAALTITGYGLDEHGKMDSYFRSISQPFENRGVDEIMFARTDIASGEEHYSKTTLYIDPISRHSWFSGPSDIWAQSVLYGYEEDGVRHAELALQRADKGLSERRIAEKLGTASAPSAPLSSTAGS